MATLAMLAPEWLSPIVLRTDNKAWKRSHVPQAFTITSRYYNRDANHRYAMKGEGCERAFRWDGVKLLE